MFLSKIQVGQVTIPSLSLSFFSFIRDLLGIALCRFISCPYHLTVPWTTWGFSAQHPALWMRNWGTDWVTSPPLTRKPVADEKIQLLPLSLTKWTVPPVHCCYFGLLNAHESNSNELASSFMLLSACSMVFSHSCNLWVLLFLTFPFVPPLPPIAFHFLKISSLLFLGPYTSNLEILFPSWIFTLEAVSSL